MLREKIPELVARGDLGFAAGERPEGGFNRLWFNEKLPPEEIDFVYDVFVVRKDRAKALREKSAMAATAVQESSHTVAIPPVFALVSSDSSEPVSNSGNSQTATKTIIKVTGLVPAELWNRFGSKIIPKLRSAQQLQARVDLSVEVETVALASLEAELLQVLAYLGLNGKVTIEKNPQY